MRVTKTVKDYITKEVRKKLEVKYMAEKLQAQKENEIRKTVENEVEVKFNKLVKELLETAVEKYPFLEPMAPNSDGDYGLLRYKTFIHIKDEVDTSNIHKWQTRLNKEVEENVENIIVTLELGGTKADLDRMLSEIC